MLLRLLQFYWKMTAEIVLYFYYNNISLKIVIIQSLLHNKSSQSKKNIEYSVTKLQEGIISTC